MSRAAPIAALGFGFAICAGPQRATSGECRFRWQSGGGLPGVGNVDRPGPGFVRELLTWDPDGAGPAEEVVLVGGDFAVAGNVLANHLATWNGSVWSSVAGDLGGGVFAAIAYREELIVARSAAHPTARVVRWDGASWEPLGLGPNNFVFALHVFDDELIAGGFFNGLLDGTPASRVAAWDGAKWRPLGDGFGGGSSPRVSALADYKGELVAAGSFTASGDTPLLNIARWDGLDWQPLGDGLQDDVTALAVYGGELIAAGWFNAAGGAPADYIARWDGHNWQPLGSGLNGNASVLVVVGEELWVGGAFDLAGGIVADHVAVWNGKTWRSTMGVGLKNVAALGSYGGDVFIGGQFVSVDGVAAHSVARWDGAQWKSLGDGNSGRVRAMTVHEGELVLGGDIREIGGVAARGVARREGLSWSALGDGIDVDGSPGVHALTSYEGSLIAGGSFSKAGGVSATNVARWDGKAWHPMGEGLSPGPNVDVAVRALHVHLDTLLAGGQFYASGEESVSTIAAWIGDEWVEYAPGISASAPGVYYGGVTAMTTVDSDLIVGGGFVEAGGAPAFFVARWDGMQWHAMDVGVGGVPYIGGVYDFQVFDGQLVAAGAFEGAGSDADAVGIARWDGAAWHAMGSAVRSGGYPGPHVSALAIFNGTLFAAGQFDLKDGQFGGNIAHWDGVDWRGLPGETGEMVDALQVYDGKLFSGGSFTIAGGAVSAYLARWESERALGDASGDAIVDLADVPGWAQCVQGPSVDETPSATAECLCALNADGDSDVDLVDLSAILLLLRP